MHTPPSMHTTQLREGSKCEVQEHTYLTSERCLIRYQVCSCLIPPVKYASRHIPSMVEAQAHPVHAPVDTLRSHDHSGGGQAVCSCRWPN